MSLTPTRFERIQRLFHDALDQPADRRVEFLREQAPDDLPMQQEVLGLIAADEAGRDRFVSPVSPAAIREASGTERWIGVRLGAYRVTRRIGEGGMGTVYEAVRDDDEFSRRVAVKLLRRGLESDLAIRRFRNERQILANLAHPNIAALLDGGTTADGQPYIVMEYVDGEPITRWCAERRLPVRERVALFTQVCEAVQHAHQNLVLHRDLKPGNILVTADGAVKLLDFGIAKLMAAAAEPGTELTASFTATQFGQRAFTPEYAAPEQFREQRVGTPADVYALGGVLFELLTGRRPFQLEGKSFAEVERTVCGVDPPRPSLSLRTDHWQSLGERSESRARERIAGDLDAIVLMALRKEPERRYPSMEQLRRDLLDHAAGRSVIARPEGVAHRLRKWVRRHRLEVAAAAALVLTLAGGMWTTARQARQAESERARTAAINDFLLTMLGAADPGSLGPDATVRVVLDDAAVKAGSLGGEPELEAEVRTAIGRTYVGLGDYAAAREHFNRVLELRRARAARGDRSSALTLGHVAGTFEFEGDYASADSLHQAALAMFRAHTRPTDPQLGSMLDNAARSRHNLGDLETAERLYRDAIAARVRANGPDDPELVFSYNNLGSLMGDRGDLAAADSLHALTVEVARRVHGERHPVVASALGNHAGLLERRGQLASADSLLRVTLEMRGELLGEEHPDYAWTLFNHAQLLLRRERWSEAAARARQVLALRGRTLADSHPAVSTAMQALGVALAGQDSLDAAIPLLRESVALRRAHLPENHWLIASGEGVLGDNLAKRGDFRAAEPLLLGSERQLLEQLGAAAMQVRDARDRLVRLYEAWGRPGDADHWRTQLAESAATS